MSNHWIDIRNADCVLIIGSNAAENLLQVGDQSKGEGWKDHQR
jgi:anaerobic selenocysteine-containing dehydrogenase